MSRSGDNGYDLLGNVKMKSWKIHYHYVMSSFSKFQKKS